MTSLIVTAGDICVGDLTLTGKYINIKGLKLGAWNAFYSIGDRAGVSIFHKEGYEVINTKEEMKIVLDKTVFFISSDAIEDKELSLQKSVIASGNYIDWSMFMHTPLKPLKEKICPVYICRTKNKITGIIIQFS